MKAGEEQSKALREAALLLVRRLRGAGFEALWAGGCVRDMLMGLQPHDYDVATSARPEQVQSLFERTIPVGKAFGVILVLQDEFEFEVATFRGEGVYEDGRHPSEITFADARRDAERRDFTVNGLFYDPIAEQVRDYVGGRRDLDARLLRCIGDPRKRFGEDALRLMRAVRFQAVLRFDLEPRTAAAVRELAPSLTRVSAERIGGELTRILLESPRPGDALLRMEDLGLLRAILPEVAAMRGQEQPPAFHPEGDVLDHTVLMLNAMRERSPELAYAVLLHDVGKPPTATMGEDRIRFHRHAQHGEELAERVLRRLRLPGRLIERVREAVRHHMHFMDVQRMRPGTLRRFMGREGFEVELELHRLDCLASHGKLDNYRHVLDARAALDKEPVLPPRWVRGADILALGVPQGPEVGTWLTRAYDAQLEGRYEGRRELLAAVARALRSGDLESL